MTVEARGATFNGKKVEFELEDACVKAVAQWLTDGRIVVDILQRFGGKWAWIFIHMEEWNGERLVEWENLGSPDDDYKIGPSGMPIRDVINQINVGIKQAIDSAV